MLLDDIKAINHSKLTEIKASINTEEMMSWVEDILDSYSEFLACPNYQSVFLSKDIDNREKIIGAAGRLLGIKVSVSTTEILGELDYLGKVIYSTKIKPESKYSTTPFNEIFVLCKSLYNRIKESLATEFYLVPFIGGIKSITLKDRSQEIVNYYLPEIELFGGDDRFDLFTASHIPDNIFQPRPIANDEELPSVGFSTISEEPSKVDYFSTITNVVELLNEGDLKKIVIARKRSIKPGENFERNQYAKYLYRKYFQEYFYLFRQGEDAYWTGISPELMFKQEGRLAVIEPLAGTRKKTSDGMDLEAIREELTNTPKESSEHDHAAQFMYDQLVGAEIGQVRKDNNKTLLETPYAFHIKSQIFVDLDPSSSFFDIVRGLYPPPTAWGIPIEKTEKTLMEFQPFDREFYAGLYGYWTFADTANIALVIRSVKVGEDSISIYAGCGIVALSDPTGEYEESDNKMSPFLSYFEN